MQFNEINSIVRRKAVIHSWVECLPEIVIAERIFVNRAFESQFEANVIKLFMKFVMELNI